MNKHTKYSNIKWAEFEDIGGGAVGGDTRDGADVGAAANKESSTPAFDPKEFAKEFSSTFASEFVTKTKEATSTKQLSQEEIEKTLNFWKPTKEWFADYDNLDTREKAVLAQRDGLATQMTTIMQAYLHELDTKWKQQFEPVQQMLTQRQQAEQIAKFESAYPSLAKPSLADVRSTIGQRLQVSGAFKDKTESEAFKILAEAMASVAKEFDPNFSLEASASNNRAANTSRSGNSINPTSVGSNGGGSGGGGNEGSGFKQPKAVSFLPKIR